MSDATLLICGCVVSFIAASGAYVYLRGNFWPAEGERADPEPQPAKIVVR